MDESRVAAASTPRLRDVADEAYSEVRVEPSTPPTVGVPVVETRDLRKVFRGRNGEVVAVDGVDLHVRSGEIFGFLGPNGAGKTTTLRMLATPRQCRWSWAWDCRHGGVSPACTAFPEC